jgi:nickel/cobalt transporter (NiCoT) family protein
MLSILNALSDHGPKLKARVVTIYAGLIAANLAAWVWALSEFHDNSVLLGTCVLAYVIGCRHAVDPDHIAAIDNVTRKLMQEGKRPLAVGLWFALGHSTIIIVAAPLVAFAAANLADGPFKSWRDVGGVISTGISAGFLFLIAIFNLLVLAGVWRTFRQVQRTKSYVSDDLDALLAKRGFLNRILGPLFTLISRSWHMFPLGFLFGLGFDTATEISLFGLSAAEASKGTSFWSIMVFPALFTAGMTLIDTTDGVLMLGAYQWAYVKPVRKILYNLAITFISVAVALMVGSLEVLGLVAARYELEGWFWNGLRGVNENFGMLGFLIVGLFAAAWLVSWSIYRIGRFEELESES